MHIYTSPHPPTHVHMKAPTRCHKPSPMGFPKRLPSTSCLAQPQPWRRDSGPLRTHGPDARTRGIRKACAHEPLPRTHEESIKPIYSSPLPPRPPHPCAYDHHMHVHRSPNHFSFRNSHAETFGRVLQTYIPAYKQCISVCLCIYLRA